jgi:hypothetical protein
LASLDSILCGGFHCGHITELVGDSASGVSLLRMPGPGPKFCRAGKTQLLLQVAAKCCVSDLQGSADCLVTLHLHSFRVNWNSQIFMQPLPRVLYIHDGHQLCASRFENHIFAQLKEAHFEQADDDRQLFEWMSKRSRREQHAIEFAFTQVRDRVQCH